MGTLENLRSMRKEAKEKETRLFQTQQRAGVLSIKDLEEGKTTLRIVKHDNDAIPFVPFRSTWLAVDEPIQTLSRYNMTQVIKDKKLEKSFGVKKVEDLKDKSDDEIREVLIEELGADFTLEVNKRIFISKMHGDPTIPDVIEEYIKFANKMINDITQDQDERKAKRCPITGFKDKKGEWHPGIMPGTSYMCYVYEWDKADRELKRFEMWEKNMDEIEKLYVALDDPDEPLTVDPFSDPLQGIPLVFDKSKNDKGKYDIIINDKRKPSGMSEKDFFSKYALTDSLLAEIAEKPSLTEMYVNVYGRKDFELALNGLQRFDEANSFGVFDNDEFMAIVEEIAAKYDNDSASAPETKPEKESKVSRVKDDLDVLNTKPGKVAERERMAPKQEVTKPAKKTRREELTEYIRENNLGIRILPRHTDDDIAEMIQEVEDELNAPNSDATESIPEPTQEIKENSIREKPTKPEVKKEEVKREDPKPASDISDRIARFRQNLKKKED